MSLRILPLALVAAGCSTVVAPEEFEDLVVFGFTGFDDADVQDVTATEMSVWVDLDTIEADLLEGYKVTDLSYDDLVQAGVQTDDTEVEIVGAAGMVVLEAPLDAVAEAWTHRRMDEVFESTVGFEILSEDGDRACFLSRECRTWAYDAHRMNDNGFFGTSEQDFRREFSWATLDDGTEAMMMRDLAPTPAEMSLPIVVVDQQYSYTIFLGRGQRTVQVGTFWVDARAVGIELPDAFAVDFAIDGMNTDAEAIVAFIES